MYRVPPELVAAFIDVESGWNPLALSKKGAMGLMQLMPTTARRFGAFDPYDIEQNIAAGTRLLATLMWGVSRRFAARRGGLLCRRLFGSLRSS